MVLSIKNAEADRLARDLSALTGESITDAVVASLKARLESERRRRHAGGIEDIVERFGRLPVLDEQDPDGIIGYADHGLPS